MMLVVRRLLLGAVLGVVLGSLACALVHLVKIGEGLDPEFHLASSIGVVMLFVLSGAGAAAGRALDLRAWQSAIVLLASSAPVLVVGAALTMGEIDEILARDLTPPWTIELVAMVAVIAGVVLVTPYAGWRVGRRRRGVARMTEPADARRYAEKQ